MIMIEKNISIIITNKNIFNKKKKGKEYKTLVSNLSIL